MPVLAPPAPRVGALTDLHVLRRELAELGFMRKAPGRVIFELSLAVVTTLAGCAIFWLAGPVVLKIVGLVIATGGMMAVGTNSHTSSHRATSDSRAVNDALTYFGLPFFLGLSATSWWKRHVQVHHPAPNVKGVDWDVDLLPWFAMTAEEVQSTTGLRHFYHRHLQFWVFPFVLAANSFNMTISGWRHVIANLADPKTRRRAHAIDLAALVAHVGAWLVLPCFFLPVGAVVACYVLRMALMSYAMYSVFAPGHHPPEATRLAADPSQVDFALLQAASSMNFEGGTLARLTCSGLQYQIEHHLFPNVCHVHYRAMAPHVREFCERHGLPYRTYGWGESLWRSWRVLRDAAVTTPDLETSRLSR